MPFRDDRSYECRFGVLWPAPQLTEDRYQPPTPGHSAVGTLTPRHATAQMIDLGAAAVNADRRTDADDPAASQRTDMSPFGPQVADRGEPAGSHGVARSSSRWTTPAPNGIGGARGGRGCGTSIGRPR